MRVSFPRRAFPSLASNTHKLPESSDRAILEATVEPLYEAALLAALKRIHDERHAYDLAIQWDVALEFAYLEGVVSSPLWFSPAKEGLVDRALKLAAAGDEGV